MTLTLDQLLTRNEIDHETLESLDLEGRDLGDKELVGCTFRHVKLQKTRWKNALLEDCVFESCDLTAMLPAQLGMRGVQFKHCKMLGIDWSDVGPYPVLSFDECNLSYASFAGITARKTRFTRCVLTEATFLRADLAESSFEGAQLAGARFEQCNLEKVSFATANDLVLDAARNRVRGAKVSMDAAVRMAEAFGLKVV